MGNDYLPDFWKGLPVVKHRDQLDQLVTLLPGFEMRPFGEGKSANEFLKQIVRRPIDDDPRTIPVGVVSWNYMLIQHIDVVNILRMGFKQANIEENLAECTLYLSTYGERMKLWVALHGLDFDPGDGRPLRVVVSCQNSVEGSCALEIKVIQVRLVCENGMVFGPGAVFRKTHIPRKLDEQDISRAIHKYLDRLAKEQLVFSRWYQTPVKPDQLRTWVDTTVAKNWGNPEAARVAAICWSGCDGKVQPIKDLKPSQWQVSWDRMVPGANAPVNNVYHAAQALSWVASHQKDLDDRQKMIEEIPELVKDLVEKSSLPIDRPD